MCSQNHLQAAVRSQQDHFMAIFYRETYQIIHPGLVEEEHILMKKVSLGSPGNILTKVDIPAIIKIMGNI